MTCDRQVDQLTRRGPALGSDLSVRIGDGGGEGDGSESSGEEDGEELHVCWMCSGLGWV